MQTLISLLADGLLLPIGVIALYALIWRVPRSRRYDIYTRIMMAGISSYLLAKLVSAVWQPEKLRPFEKLGIDAGASSLNNPGFPSDHALFAMFLTLAVWYVTRSRTLTLAMFVLVLLMCTGRVLALVHTPFDIVGGMAFACVGALWYAQGTKVFKNTLAKTSKR